MLLNDLYSIQELTHGNGVIKTSITLNATHIIFNGHFPGQPVLPGVCMMQIVRELLETVLEQPFQLSVATNVKFISLVVPTISPVIQIQLSSKTVNEKITVSASATANEMVCFKFQGTYLMQPR